MNKKQITKRSESLGRDMDVIVYGSAGYPVVAFPTQNYHADDLENCGMIDALAEFVDAEKIQLFCVDAIDAESWSAQGADNDARVAAQEAYMSYVAHEVTSLVHEENGSTLRPLTFGCSMGATQALLALLRFPEEFQGVIGLSGVYDARVFFGDWMSEDLFYNSVVDFLPGMPADHPYVELLRNRSIVLCSGQGAWEEDSVRTLHVVDDALKALGIDAWCDFWGADVNHDWPWWTKQVRYFLPVVLDKVQEATASEAPAAPAKKAATRKKAAAKKPAAKKPAAKKAAATTEAAAEKTAAAAAVATEAEAAEAKPAAKKTTTRKSSTAAKKSTGTAAKKSTSTAAKKTTTRKSTAKKAAAPAEEAAPKADKGVSPAN